MKEAIGGTSLFFIVIAILSVFAIYISISLNWSAAYKVKDEILFYIEKNKGFNKMTMKEIQQYTKKNGYGSWGECPDASCWIPISINTGGRAMNKAATNLCVRKMYYKQTTELPETAYYSIKVFFKLDIPIVSSMDIYIDGETSPLYHTKEDINGIKWTRDGCEVS